jgi:hypothetical protein
VLQGYPLHQSQTPDDHACPRNLCYRTKSIQQSFHPERAVNPELPIVNAVLWFHCELYVESYYWTKVTAILILNLNSRLQDEEHHVFLGVSP